MSSTANTSSSKSSESPTPSEPYLWDVQEILAHRTSVTGEDEVLVVMKTEWVPISAIFADCPAMQRFQESVQWSYKTDSETMSIKLPVQPGSAFARDFAMDQAMAPASASRLSAIAAARRNHTLQSYAPAHCARCTLSIFIHHPVQSVHRTLTMLPLIQNDRIQDCSTKPPDCPKGPNCTTHVSHVTTSLNSLQSACSTHVLNKNAKNDFEIAGTAV